MLLETDIVGDIYNVYKPSQSIIIWGTLGLAFLSLIWFNLIYLFAPSFYRTAKYGITISISIMIAVSNVFMLTGWTLGLLGIDELNLQINYINIVLSVAIYVSLIMIIMVGVIWYWLCVIVSKHIPFKWFFAVHSIFMIYATYFLKNQISSHFPKPTKETSNIVAPTNSNIKTDTILSKNTSKQMKYPVSNSVKK